MLYNLFQFNITPDFPKQLIMLMSITKNWAKQPFPCGVVGVGLSGKLGAHSDKQTQVTPQIWPQSHPDAIMMTSWHGNAVCITGPLWGESTCDRWILLAKGQWCRALMFSLLLDWTGFWLIDSLIDSLGLTLFSTQKGHIRKPQTNVDTSIDWTGCWRNNWAASNLRCYDAHVMSL